MRLLKKIVIGLLSILMILSIIPFLIPVHGGETEFRARFLNSKFMEVEGITYHYRTWNAPDSVKGNILLVHGFSGSTFSWRKNADSLAAMGFSVLAVDVPPFGYSDRSPEMDYSASSQAIRLWKILDTLSKGDWILAGHSMGASLVGAMTSMKPSRVRGLILVDGPYYGTHRTGFFSRAGRRMVRSGILKRWAEVIGQKKMYRYDSFSSLLSSAYGQEADSAAVLGYLNPFIEMPGTASGVFDMAGAVEERELDPSVIECPVLILWGEKDQWIPVTEAENMKALFPNAAYRIIAGAGHCSMETHPGQFNSEVREFIRKLSSNQ